VSAATWGPPEVRMWTTDDLDELPDDGVKRELVDGVLIVSPAPQPHHQKLAGLLMAWLEHHCPSEFAANQGVEVRISSTRSLIPDVVVVMAEAEDRHSRWFRPADVQLAIEVVSPGSVSMDRLLKPGLYAAAGIPSYWRIEFEERGIVVYTYLLDPTADLYRETGVFDKVVQTDLPWPMELPLTKITPRALRG